MSLYSIIMGGGGDRAAVMLAILEDAHPQPENTYVRSRDGFVEERDGKVIIRIHTRSGGGNRECYCEDFDSHEFGCIASGNDWMVSHPWYLSDEDDDFDSTYADFYFTVPDDHELVSLLRQHAAEHVDIGARWQAAIDAIKGAGG